LLVCRAVLSEKDPTWRDPESEDLLQKLFSSVNEEEQAWISKLKRRYAGVHLGEARASLRRDRLFDVAADEYIAAHPGCTVINLACGFDTRYWHLKQHDCTYIELDLPEMVRLKQELLGERLTYEMIASSVLDTAWIDRVTGSGNRNFLLLAQGLFMYLPEQEVLHLFRTIGDRFTNSRLMATMASTRWTKGLGKAIVHLNSRLDWGLDVDFTFGIRSPRDMEEFSPVFKVIKVEDGTVGPVVTVSINGDIN
jgi:O-methyltransferase involved in polyketide biosynthesis